MKGMRVMLGAIVGRLCQTPRGQVGVSQKRPTNPTRGIISGVVLNTIAAFFAVAQGAAPEGPARPEASVTGEIDSYLDSLVAENKLSGADYPNKVSGVGLYQRRAHEFGPSGDDAGDHGNPAADSAGVTFQETVRRGLTQLRQPRTVSG